MRYDDDERVGEDFGQFDDDGGPQPIANFVPAGAGQPWLRGGMPPWHLWGNSQRIVAPVQDSSLAARTNSPGQLVKISYKRPETWHWIFAAKLLSGPDGTVTEQLQVEVAFDLTIGIGRSNIILQSAPPNLDKAFEQYFSNGAAAPPWCSRGTCSCTVRKCSHPTASFAPMRLSRIRTGFPSRAPS